MGLRADDVRGAVGEGRTTGRVRHPDFYLPEHDLYLELTTMRQRLVTRKNRKFRLLRESYPNVRVRLLYLRDFKRLRDVYGPSGVERQARIGAILYAEQDVEMRIAQLAHQLIEGWRGNAASERGQRPLLVGVGSGSNRFLASLGEISAAQAFLLILIVLP